MTVRTNYKWCVRTKHESTRDFIFCLHYMCVCVYTHNTKENCQDFRKKHCKNYQNFCGRLINFRMVEMGREAEEKVTDSTLSFCKLKTVAFEGFEALNIAFRCFCFFGLLIYFILFYSIQYIIMDKIISNNICRVF